MKNTVTIYYCPKCNWLLRSAWMAQELMLTFHEQLHAVTLEKGESGQFEIYANDVLMWNRKKEGGFPELKILKQKIRDIIAPDMLLGHSDQKKSV